jgi:3',5'-cyclic AMP phosphodiesterase CpdA
MFKLNYKKPIILISLIITLIFLLTSCSFLESQESLPSPIIVYGDSRTNHQIHQKIVDEIIKTKPAIVFHTGDLVEDGLIPAQWTTFNEILSDLTKIAEFYPALGNHENNSPLYFDNFGLPNNERWYIVEKDNLHFIILDSNSDCSVGSEQYLWLENDLQNINENLKFIIAIFHHPSFSTGPHTEDEKGLRKNIVPLFEQYGVDIVFNGHDHDYERSLYNNIYYIVTGGGGAPLYDQARTSPYSQLFIKAYHFCKLSLINDQLIIEVYDIDSNLIDEFIIK